MFQYLSNLADIKVDLLTVYFNGGLDIREEDVRLAAMARAKKAGAILIKLASTAGTGFFYVTKKNPRRITTKLQFMKHDPIVNKHVLFTETKLK